MVASAPPDGQLLSVAHDPRDAQRIVVRGEAIVPPGEDPLGVPYGEWAAKWWWWLLSTPLAENPGEVDNCQAGQGGEVFYIAHVLPSVTVETSCSVATDQHIHASGGATMYDITECGGTEEGLRACIEADLQAEPAIVSAVSVTVDGQVVPEIESYWVVSPLFDVEYIEENIYGMEPGTVSQAMIGGSVCPSGSSLTASSVGFAPGLSLTVGVLAFTTDS